MIAIDNITLHRADCMDIMAGTESGSQHLIIVDPPYFEVKGDFDFSWDSFPDYLEDVEKWAAEVARILADNGTVLWWGHAKKIAYTQIILDRHLMLANSLVWKKTECQTKRQDFDAARAFAPVTERLLMYAKGDISGLESIKLDIGNFKPLRDYFERLQGFIGKGGKKIGDELGHQRADHCFRWGSTQWDMPVPEVYRQIETAFNTRRWEGFRELRQEYEELRQEYEELRRPFNNYMKLEDVLDFSQEAHITEKHDHPTQKPPTLCSALIRTCSKKGMNAFIPFVGSGVEVIEASRFGLNVIGCELDQDYFDAACERVYKETRQQELF